MENDHAPQEIEALTREVARLEQVVAEKRFDESRSAGYVDPSANAKQRI